MSARFELPPFPEFAADVLGLDMATRRGHVAIQKALDGLPLDDGELALFTEYTGREANERNDKECDQGLRDEKVK